jgi:hypothetical protein
VKIKVLLSVLLALGLCGEAFAQSRVLVPGQRLYTGDVSLFQSLDVNGGQITLNPISTVDEPTVDASGTTGAETYGYVIVATNGAGTTDASPEGQTVEGNATLDGTNFNTVTWTEVAFARGYKVYRVTGGATQGLIATLGTIGTLNDTGLVGGGETPEATNTTGTIIGLPPSVGGLADVVDDTTPQLGGDLDANGSQILGSASTNCVAPTYAFTGFPNSGFTIDSFGDDPGICVLGSKLINFGNDGGGDIYGLVNTDVRLLTLGSGDLYFGTGITNQWKIEGADFWSVNNGNIGDGAGNSPVNIYSEAFVFQGVTAGITASVTQTQGQGVLTTSTNIVSTVATDDDTVTLPGAIAGQYITIVNNGANRLQIFPASGDNLGAGVDIATKLRPGRILEFFCYDTTNCRTTADREPIIIVVTDFVTATAIGDGQFYLPIGEKYAGQRLVGVSGYTNIAGTTGTLNVDLAKCAPVATGNQCSGTVGDMLSTNLTFDSTHNKSSTATTPAVISAAQATVGLHDVIRVDVDAIMTTPSQGLVLELIFSR